MKKLLCCFVLGAGAHIAYADEAPIAHEYLRSARFVYLNSNLIGYFPVCIDNASNEFFFLDDFFEQVNLVKSSATAQCQGQRYTRPVLAFVRNDAAGTLSATSTAGDFTALPGSAPSASSAQDSAARANTTVIQASSLQHALGLTVDATGATNLTLGAAAQYYTDAGMFSVEGVAASEAGKTQSYLRDINWKRHFSDSATNASFGLSTISAPGSAVRLYGFVLGSDEESVNNNGTQSINGFAELFGKVQIRSRGILLKEVPVSVGNFSISTADLPASSGAPGQYTLTLVDDSGRAVRSWDVFVPLGARLLRSGRSNWSVYAGQIESSGSTNSLLGGPQNLGAGVSASYGINAWLTADVFSVLSPHVKGIGLAATVVPAAWLSATAGQARYMSAEQGGTSLYGSVNVHSEQIGATTSILRVGCAAQASASLSLGGAADDQCTNVSSSVYAFNDSFGRLALQHTQNKGALSSSSGIGFNWTAPSFGTASLALYGNRLSDSGSAAASNSYGFTLTLPFGRGQLMNTVNFSSPNSKTIATTYQESINNELQYSMTADTGNAAPSSLHSTLQYRPWYGTYQANAQMSRQGQQSIGLNESGALVFAQEQVLTAQQSGQGYAIIHLDKLSDLPLEDGAGQRQAVINEDGYAALAVARGSESDMRISPEELPDNINIEGRVMGRISDNWQATLWEPVVRTVNKGWARLVFSPGHPVQLGATLRLKAGDEPTYVFTGGDIFFNDFPAGASHMEVILSGNTGRCFVDFPADIKLKQGYFPDKPELTCVAPALSEGVMTADTVISQ